LRLNLASKVLSVWCDSRLCHPV